MSFAFSIPICLIPIEKINFSKETFFEFSIEFFKLFTEVFPQPSKLMILSYFKAKIS